MSDFVNLCMDGRLSEVEASLRRGQDVNTKNSSGRTGLIWAAVRGHTSVVQLLLTVENCDVNCQSNNGHTALHLASFIDNSEIVRSLLAHPGMRSENIRGYGGQTPLMRAVMRGSVESVRLLVSDGRVDLETRDDQGKGLEEWARWGR